MKTKFLEITKETDISKPSNMISIRIGVGELQNIFETTELFDFDSIMFAWDSKNGTRTFDNRYVREASKQFKEAIIKLKTVEECKGIYEKIVNKMMKKKEKEHGKRKVLKRQLKKIGF